MSGETAEPVNTQNTISFTTATGFSLDRTETQRVLENQPLVQANGGHKNRIDSAALIAFLTLCGGLFVVFFVPWFWMGLANNYDDCFLIKVFGKYGMDLKTLMFFSLTLVLCVIITFIALRFVPFVALCFHLFISLLFLGVFVAVYFKKGPPKLILITLLVFTAILAIAGICILSLKRLFAPLLEISLKVLTEQPGIILINLLTTTLSIVFAFFALDIFNHLTKTTKHNFLVPLSLLFFLVFVFKLITKISWAVACHNTHLWCVTPSREAFLSRSIRNTILNSLASLLIAVGSITLTSVSLVLFIGVVFLNKRHFVLVWLFTALFVLLVEGRVEFLLGKAVVASKDVCFLMFSCAFEAFSLRLALDVIALLATMCCCNVAMASAFVYFCWAASTQCQAFDWRRWLPFEGPLGTAALAIWTFGALCTWEIFSTIRASASSVVSCHKWAGDRFCATNPKTHKTLREIYSDRMVKRVFGDHSF